MNDIALQTLTATKEVILSAGTIGTPRILLSSGIGPSTELAPLGINTIVDIADVGKNFSDHPFVSNSFVVNSTNTFDSLTRQTTPLQQAVSAWQATGTGPLVNPIASQIGWFRLNSTDPIFQTVQDPSAGPMSGHHELLISVRFILIYCSPLTFLICTSFRRMVMFAHLQLATSLLSPRLLYRLLLVDPSP